MLLLIDNYDSFTWNLVHYFGELGAEVVVRRNDALGVDDALALGPRAIVLSSGPCTPGRAGICPDLVPAASAADIPLLGVGLGHQVIGEVLGARITPCPEIAHGKMGRIIHDGRGLFHGIPSPFLATRYHSLMIERESLPDELEVSAWLEDGIIMGLRHRTKNIHGVQFHPESIASEHGHDILGNFLRSAGIGVPA